MTLLEFEDKALEICAEHGYANITVFAKATCAHHNHIEGRANRIMKYGISFFINTVCYQTQDLPTPNSALAHLESMLLAMQLATGSQEDMELSEAREESEAENG